jgi:hypothetical protein
VVSIAANDAQLLYAAWSHLVCIISGHRPSGFVPPPFHNGGQVQFSSSPVMEMTSMTRIAESPPAIATLAVVGDQSTVNTPLQARTRQRIGPDKDEKGSGPVLEVHVRMANQVNRAPDIETPFRRLLTVIPILFVRYFSPLLV